MSGFSYFRNVGIVEVCKQCLYWTPTFLSCHALLIVGFSKIFFPLKLFHGQFLFKIYVSQPLFCTLQDLPGSKKVEPLLNEEMNTFDVRRPSNWF